MSVDVVRFSCMRKSHSSSRPVSLLTFACMLAVQPKILFRNEAFGWPCLVHTDQRCAYLSPHVFPDLLCGEARLAKRALQPVHLPRTKAGEIQISQDLRQKSAITLARTLDLRRGLEKGSDSPVSMPHVTECRSPRAWRPTRRSFAGTRPPSPMSLCGSEVPYYLTRHLHPLLPQITPCLGRRIRRTYKHPLSSAQRPGHRVTHIQ